MIQLKFTEKELEILKEYFQSELYKAEQKIDNIKGILGKIGLKNGAVSNTIRTAGRPGRKKGGITLKSENDIIVIKKKPGPKPKQIQNNEISVLTPLKRKRGRPPNDQKLLQVKPNSIKPSKPDKTSSDEVVVKRGPGRPRKNPLELKNEAKKKQAVKERKNQAAKILIVNKPVKEGKKTGHKKEHRAPKTPWRDWILTVLRDSENNLTQDQIFKTVAERLKLSGNEIPAAEKRVKEQMGKLLLSKKIIKATQGDNPAYSLKIRAKA